jgi:hypothetical protein
MTTLLLLSWLVSILSTSPALAKIGNDEVSLIQYAHNVAMQEHISPVRFVKLMDCESGISFKATGDYRKETGEFMAFGPFQWWEKSFSKYEKQYNLDLDYKDPYDQTLLAAIVIGREKDGVYNWTNCARYIHWIK